MGLGAQLLLWRTEFCEKLVNQGLRVIRYDNRDVGLSTKLSGQRVDSALVPNLVRSFVGKPSPAVYTLEDLSDDAAALLDHLEIERAHVVGASMGGMIAQIVAARFPQRTQTLAVIFSSNNQALLPPPGYPQLRALLQRPSGSTAEAIVANAVRVAKTIGSPGYPRAEDKLAADALEGYERAYYPAGIARHFGAVLGSGSLVRYDRQITAPTVVIHGKADKLMRPSGGRAIARAIPGARLVLIDGMAHDLPEELWDQIVGELKTNFAEAS
jgi:pimeloyl-ACP methyl ester carboxylesterase